ncbi:MAG: ABC transporter substrate-binding protein [Alphaproteobacteria bacterium]|nr:ABC transporter substrate-binding protein [Alphaproteobacteria bacterium]
MRRRTFLTGLPLTVAAARRARAETPTPAPASGTTRTYVLTMLDKPGLPPDFPAFPYVNPDAPKGGEAALAAIGSFDSFNGFIVRGTPAADLGRIYDTLLRVDADEASTAYCHLATVAELPADRSWVAFELRPEARFHDGEKVTADDVVWTFDTLRGKGRPFYRAYYADVEQALAESPARVVFRFKTNKNRELPLILGEMPVLPKHWWQGREFDKPLTDPPLGSGPYQVDRVDFGRSISYRLAPDYWGKDLPTARGLNNIAVVRTEYFRDATVAFEAFKAGQIDFREENIAKQWATGYDFPALKRGLVKKEVLRHHLPTGMQGFAMNTRREIFKDRRVRQAMDLVFDFEWCNKELFYNAYTRTNSYYSNSDLACSGIPQGDELKLLEPFRAQLPADLFTAEFKLPVTDGSGNNRENLIAALKLLKQAGWEVKERKLIDKNGSPFSFEILLDQPAFERVALPYVQWLAHLGIEARVRTVDPAQYQRLMDEFQFDMTVALFSESDSPGNEQVNYWTSGSAKQTGSDNLMGVSDPVVDALVGQLIVAPDRAHLVTICHALDRVLLWSWYVVPHWHLQSVRVAYWDRFGRPDKPVRTGVSFDSWWVDQKLASATDTARRAGIQ